MKVRVLRGSPTLLDPTAFPRDPACPHHDLDGGRARRARQCEPRPRRGRAITGPKRAAYPAELEKWPAVIGFLFFVWLELAYAGAGSGVVLIGYTLVTVAAMTYFGRDEWRQNGETFGLWFGTLNRLAPLGADDPDGRRLVRRPFATGLFEPGWTPGVLLLAAIGAGSILYDGLSQTEVWFTLFGAPNFAGATIQLLSFLMVVAAIALAVSRLVGIAALGAGIVPIAIGYLVAHSFTYLISDGQRIVVAISDPLQQGWDLFGTAFYEPAIDWLPAAAIWTIQLVAVVGGHMLGAWAGHAATGESDTPERRSALLRQVALAVLMVGLTTTTLWSLGQAVVAEAVRPV